MEIKIKRNDEDPGLYEEYIKFNLCDDFIKTKTMSKERLKNLLFFRVINNNMKLIENKD